MVFTNSHNAEHYPHSNCKCWEVNHKKADTIHKIQQKKKQLPLLVLHK